MDVHLRAWQLHCNEITPSEWTSATCVVALQVAAVPEDANAPLRPGGDVDGAQFKLVTECRHMRGGHHSHETYLSVSTHAGSWYGCGELEVCLTFLAVAQI